MEKLMKTFTRSLVQGIGLSIGLSIFVLGIFLVRGAWQSSNPTSGQGDPSNLYSTGEDVITKEKWNALVEKVNNVQLSNEDTCPTGFTKVEKQGNVLGCIQNAQNAPLNSYEAQLYCFNQFGGRLSFGIEWFVSIENYTLENEIDGWERIADLVSEASQLGQSGRNGFGLIGNGYTTLYSRNNANLGSYNFRCFLPR